MPESLLNVIIAIHTTIDLTSGNIIVKKIWNSFAPSSFADSFSDSGIPIKNCLNRKILAAAPIAKYEGITADEIDKIDNLTGATYSSKGFKKAVKCAIECYEQNKEAILWLN